MGKTSEKRGKNIRKTLKTPENIGKSWGNVGNI